MEQFKDNTYPHDHVRRYQSMMAQYDYVDTLLCRIFPQTLEDQGSRWFGGLASGSVRNFKELIHAFTRQFMGNIQHKKSMSVLSTLKQRKDEKLKDYLARFSQEVSEVHDPNDDAVVATFINSLQHSQSSLSLRQKGPITYANLVDDVGGYEMAEKEQIAYEGEYIHGGRPTFQKFTFIPSTTKLVPISFSLYTTTIFKRWFAGALGAFPPAK
ncbi:hypothetical protein Dsin_015013 [Dipteronia sinensis]|uniref:Retrotransposon gag domain-containing protein n=1 Tax=Dipteronia sinensis TaxID=43782 RepID=A0AAE0ANG5_9ROSI|nr:hypothetical protein Dsin_015013 [Dipteronia sinensis]